MPLLQQALAGRARRRRPAAGACCSSAPSARRSDQIAEAAKRCGQYYVNHRWLGGMLTNWKTISNSIKRLSELDDAARGGQHAA